MISESRTTLWPKSRWMMRRRWTKICLAGQNINNLVESIGDVAERNELRRVSNIASSIGEYVLILLGDRNER